MANNFGAYLHELAHDPKSQLTIELDNLNLEFVQSEDDPAGHLFHVQIKDPGKTLVATIRDGAQQTTIRILPCDFVSELKDLIQQRENGYLRLYNKLRVKYELEQ